MTPIPTLITIQGLTPIPYTKACEVIYSSAQDYIQKDEIDGVEIPYLKPELLIETKMGIRPKDIQDRNFLQKLLKRE